MDFVLTFQQGGMISISNESSCPIWPGGSEELRYSVTAAFRARFVRIQELTVATRLPLVFVPAAPNYLPQSGEAKRVDTGERPLIEHRQTMGGQTTFSHY